MKTPALLIYLLLNCLFAVSQTLQSVTDNGNTTTQSISIGTGYTDAKLNGYDLPSLAETEKHIKEKGNLPGIPSAAEVQANGIDLGLMNAKLLQKIEELTLYIIKQDKRIDELENSKRKQQDLKK